MIHAKGVLAFAATTLLFCAPGEARISTGSGRELLQGASEGRKGKDKNGNVIQETQPDGSSTTDIEAVSCTACSGTCASCDSQDWKIEDGITLKNCGEGSDGYTCDVYVSNAVMPWKGADSISWGIMHGGKCKADGNETATCADRNSAGKKEDIGGTGVKLLTVVFPDGKCSADICAIFHDGSLDPCTEGGCSIDSLKPGAGCFNTENQVCKICQKTITVAKPAEATCNDHYGCTIEDKCYGDGCGKADAGPCLCNILNDEYQNATDAYCQVSTADGGAFGDAFTCTTEECNPFESDNDSGCIKSTNVEDDNQSCAEKPADIKCTLDLCAPEEMLQGDHQDQDTGCVNRKQDSVCKDADNGFADKLTCTQETCTATSSDNGGCESLDSSNYTNTENDPAAKVCQDDSSCTSDYCFRMENKPTGDGVYRTEGVQGGCFYNVSAAHQCSDGAGCTTDRCYIEFDSPPANCAANGGYECVRGTTGCVFERDDTLCEDLRNDCGTFQCLPGGDGFVQLTGYGDAYTGCAANAGTPEEQENECTLQIDCGTEVCIVDAADASKAKTAGCTVAVVAGDDETCKEEPEDDPCTANTCIDSGVDIGTCGKTPIKTIPASIDPSEDVCVYCGDASGIANDTVCMTEAGPCFTGTCRTSGDFKLSCDFKGKADCEPCLNGVSDCPTMPCQIPSCSSDKECVYTNDDEGTVCGSADECCNASGSCDSTGASCPAPPDSCTTAGTQCTDGCCVENGGSLTCDTTADENNCGGGGTDCDAANTDVDCCGNLDCVTPGLDAKCVMCDLGQMGSGGKPGKCVNVNSGAMVCGDNDGGCCAKDGTCDTSATCPSNGNCPESYEVACYKCGSGQTGSTDCVIRTSDSLSDSEIAGIIGAILDTCAGNNPQTDQCAQLCNFFPGYGGDLSQFVGDGKAYQTGDSFPKFCGVDPKCPNTGSAGISNTAIYTVAVKEEGGMCVPKTDADGVELPSPCAQGKCESENKSTNPPPNETCDCP